MDDHSDKESAADAAAVSQQSSAVLFKSLEMPSKQMMVIQMQLQAKLQAKTTKKKKRAPRMPSSAASTLFSLADDEAATEKASLEKAQKPKSTKIECPGCRKQYVSLSNHTECPAGVCDSCGLFLRDLRPHKCPVKRYQTPVTLNVIDKYIQRNGRRCEGCKDVYPLVRNSFREWRGQTLCRDCYDSNGCQDEVDAMWKRILDEQLALGNTMCKSCDLPLLDPDNEGKRLAYYEFDHVNFWDKTDNISSMVRRGDDWTDIIHPELQKCQMLCGKCHSYMTAAENLCGYIELKKTMSALENTNAPDFLQNDATVISRWREDAENSYHGKIRDGVRILQLQIRESTTNCHHQLLTYDGDDDCGGSGNGGGGLQFSIGGDGGGNDNDDAAAAPVAVAEKEPVSETAAAPVEKTKPPPPPPRVRKRKQVAVTAAAEVATDPPRKRKRKK